MAIAQHTDWRVVLKNNWLLWDTSAIIRAIQFEAEKIFEELEGIDVANVYISPVELELLATKNRIDKLKRSDLMAEHLSLMPFTIKELNMAKRLQAAIGSIGQPSAADLYVGATLAASGSDKFYMVTHNIVDFPAPFFRKECFITLFTDVGVCSLAVLSFDKSTLR